MQAVNVPVIVGKAFIVTVAVFVQPLLFMYVMVVVPAVIPVTTPVLLIVATLVFEEVHGEIPCGVAEPVKEVVPFTQADNVPEIVGSGLTVTLTMSVSVQSVVVFVMVIVYNVVIGAAPALVSVIAGLDTVLLLNPVVGVQA
jgi:hypothetical protein